MGNKLYKLTSENETEVQYLLGCPGCGNAHPVRVKGDRPCWTWNGSLEVPTFEPSLMVWGSDETRRCHSFIRNGRIEFLSDCFHELKGQTVDLPDFEDFCDAELTDDQN